MSKGLPVNRLINVTVTLTPLAAQLLSFDTLLILGHTDVIDVGERLRSYGSLDEVVADFGTAVPEYLAADLFFSQVPQPRQLYIGRWAQASTHGTLRGGDIIGTDLQMGGWSSITDGSMNVTIDGSAKHLTSLDFSNALNLNGVASVIQSALSGSGTVGWDGRRFTVKSSSVGPGSSVSYATPASPSSGTDISAKSNLDSLEASAPVVGIAAETAVAAVAALDALATGWYGLMFASPDIVDADHLAVAAYVQGASNPHIYGVTTGDVRCLDSTSSLDIGSQLKAANYLRCFVQFSDNPYAVASFFGRAFTVDFNQSNSCITMMYKQEPGIVPTDLDSDEADVLQTKRINVLTNYRNNTAILEYGVMSGQAFFDEIHGLDWLRNRIQTDLYNLLYTTPTKVPQTDAGTHLITTVVEAGCASAVANGLVAPGFWNSAGFGLLRQGDYLQKGYYVYGPPVALQAQADREARKSVPIQAAIKLAGAVHTIDCSVLVNR